MSAIWNVLKTLRPIITAICASGSAGVSGDPAIESVAEPVGLDVEVVLGLEVEPAPRRCCEVADQTYGTGLFRSPQPGPIRSRKRSSWPQRPPRTASCGPSTTTPVIRRSCWNCAWRFGSSWRPAHRHRLCTVMPKVWNAATTDGGALVPDGERAAAELRLSPRGAVLTRHSATPGREPQSGVFGRFRRVPPDPKTRSDQALC